MHDDSASRLDLLTGPDVADLLGAALTPAGAALRNWWLRDVEHRPGDRTTATYTATVAWPDGEREETLGATVSPTPPASGPSITDGDRHVQVWRFPFDPELPGLAAACFPSTVAEMLGPLGADGAEPRLRVVSYRPRKRAVVEVTSGSRQLYLKIVRPRAAADVDRRHRMLTAAGLPVPRILGHSDDGVVTLQALSGTTLTAALASSAASASPPVGVHDLLGLLDRLPPEVADLPRRAPWPAHATHYADVVAAACPELRSRTTALADGVNAVLGADDGGDVEPTHGDFYTDQLLVAGGRVTGLLDIDTLGPGRRADDLACLLAHLELQAADDPSGGAASALSTWMPALEHRVGRRELAARTAGVLLSLATGPYRAQDPGWQEATAARLALAERRLEAV
ncbi:phosphotransferase family enzyme [Haloactinopolyspora alba]|uniref:Phosphotransferase family enzyme n=1 Tax=Haloactinopolyspora alba TaxID=648780 RepID=A0A2P8DJA2_9ACTN|nr:phosphotransferase [Haloactinopolyspora alba]PSK97268.1 phosphotransferase family enzyme [Haloactinopolyspora alba]